MFILMFRCMDTLSSVRNAARVTRAFHIDRSAKDSVCFEIVGTFSGGAFIARTTIKMTTSLYFYLVRVVARDQAKKNEVEIPSCGGDKNPEVKNIFCHSGLRVRTRRLVVPGEMGYH